MKFKSRKAQSYFQLNHTSSSEISSSAIRTAILWTSIGRFVLFAITLAFVLCVLLYCTCGGI